MTDTPKLLVFAGSTRSGSLNARLANAVALEIRRQGADATLITLADYPAPLYDGDLEEAEGVPQPMQELTAMIRDHDGVAIATPEYNAYFPPLLKNTIDWCSRPGAHSETPSLPRDKAAAVFACSPGAKGGIRVIPKLRDQLLEVGFSVAGETLAVPFAAKAFADDGTLTEDAGAGQLTTVVARLIAMARSDLSGSA
ncbi:MAG: NAD(P)H-dependent oxidoreductase [Pseudomonadota bacterium]